MNPLEKPVSKETPVLVLVNPFAGWWKTKKLWPRVEPMVREVLPNSRIVFSSSLNDFPRSLRAAYEDGIRHVVPVGGDGTIHWTVNFLASEGLLSEFCMIPLQLGTGGDWSRSLGLPERVEERIRLWENARPRLIDLILTRMDGQERYVVNVASLGLSGEVVDRISRRSRRLPWVYLTSTVESLFRYKASPMQVFVDGELWYEGRALALAIANGKAFGRGMLIAPEARPDDGLLDVVLIEDMPKPRAVVSLPKLYSGAHMSLKETHVAKGTRILVSSGEESVKAEGDGEPLAASTAEFTVLPKALWVCAGGEEPQGRRSKRQIENA